MARDSNPSGLPRDRVVKPMYGAWETDVDRRVTNQHDGFVRVRRTLLIASIVVGVLVVLLAIFGSTAGAAGMAAVMLAPLLLILAATHLAAEVTRPKQTGS